MATRRRFVRRVGARLPLRWTAQLQNNVGLAVSTQLASIIVSPADYEASATISSKGPTVVRIRGRLSFIPTMTSGVIGQLFAAVVAHDNDISTASGALSPNSAVNAIDERFLWWDHILASGSGATPPGDVNVHTRIIDIKSRVKLSDTVVSLIVITDGTMAGFVGSNFRALLRG